MQSVAVVNEYAGERLPDDDVPHGTVVDEVDQLRAQHYDLLAVLLGRAPDHALMTSLGSLRGGDSALGQPVEALARACRETAPEIVAREYHDLFVGVGRGELLPYASYYLTGFLNERPLAQLRIDLQSLGIERDDAMTEPEDHLAILLEIMANLVAGRFETDSDAASGFFVRHVEPWAARFFSDLERAKAARFYRAVGAWGRAFIEVEAQAFAMDA